MPVDPNLSSQAMLPRKPSYNPDATSTSDFLTVYTKAGAQDAEYQVLPNIQCRQVIILNLLALGNADIEVRRTNPDISDANAANMRVIAGSSYIFDVISNAGELAIRRQDNNGTKANYPVKVEFKR